MPTIEYVVTTCGEPSTDLCLFRLGTEVNKASIRVVENVHPISAACNRTLDSQADWVVQVDSDFIFHKGFASRFSAAADDAIAWEAAHGKKIHAVKFSLYDPFEQMYIGWCKAFQLAHFRAENIRYRDVNGCDTALMNDFAARGYEVVRYPPNRPIGDHYVIGNEYIYSRYSAIMSKAGLLRLDKTMLQYWAYRAVNYGSAMHACALLGVFHPRALPTERNREEERQDPVRTMIATSQPEEIVARCVELLRAKGLPGD